MELHNIGFSLVFFFFFFFFFFTVLRDYGLYLVSSLTLLLFILFSETVCRNVVKFCTRIPLLAEFCLNKICSDRPTERAVQRPS